MSTTSAMEESGITSMHNNNYGIIECMITCSVSHYILGFVPECGKLRHHGAMMYA